MPRTCDGVPVTALILALLADPAAAQSPASLVAGETMLQDCLDDGACGPALVGLVSENMAEYGFTQQVDPIAVSALGGKGMGLVVEARLDTVTLGPKNELEEQVPIPPALPRLALGYQYGSFTYDGPYPQLAAGLTVLPPFRVLGGTLVGTQLDVSGALPIGGHVLWLGAELGYGYGQLAVPLLGTRAQLQQIDAFRPWLPDDPAACEDLVDGCIDRFRQHTGQVRLGLSIEPLPAVFAYARVAGVGLVQRLAVAYDETVWGSAGGQIQGQFGGGFRAGDHYQLALGGVVASRSEALSTRRSRSMTKIVASTSFRFGRARYWERDLPPDQPDGPQDE